MAEHFTIDAGDLRKFTKAIRSASKKTGREVHDALKAAAEVVAIEARAKAYSDRIRGTIKAGAYGSSAYVQIGNKDVPEAALLEAGNAAHSRDLMRSAQSGTFKHPIYGTDTWVNDQPLHPALGPAAIANEQKAVEKIADGVTKAFRDVHLEME